MKKIVYTRIDTSESAPANQGELIRVWDRSWRLRGWKTKILLPDEFAPDGLHTCIRTINFSFKPKDSDDPVAVNFGHPFWDKCPLVVFPADITEQQILECGRSIA